MGRLLRTIRSFLASGIFTCFFGRAGSPLVAWGGLVILVALMSLNVWASVQLTYVSNTLGDMYQHTHAFNYQADPDPMVVRQREFIVVGFLLAAYVSVYFVTDNIVLYLKGRYINNWQKHMAVWHMEKARGKNIEGLSQRITDCTEMVALNFVELGLITYRALVALLMFGPMVWHLSVHFESGHNVPGILLWAIIVYCTIETLGSWLFGKKLPWFEIKRQKAVAALRSFIDLAKARMMPERRHDTGVSRKITHMYVRSNMLVDHSVPLNIWRSFCGFVWGYGPGLIIGFYVVVTMSVKLGVMAQTVLAANEVHGALSTFSNSWPLITKVQGSVRRLRAIEGQAAK